jgi:hypothetical protein
MALCYELVDSQSGTLTKEAGQSEQIEKRLHFVIGPVRSFDALIDELDPYAPTYISWRDNLLMRTQLQMNGIGNGYYDITASYQSMVPLGGESESPEGGGSNPQPGSVAYDTTGGREHITQAIGTESFPADAPNFNDAINVSGDSVNGVDVVSRSMKYTESWIIPLNIAMSSTFVRALYEFTGTVNSSPFRVFEAGEVLFLGARGQWQEDQPFVHVTFEFEARKNVTDWYPFTGYGGDGTEPKKGWEYVWYRYGKSFDGEVVQRPYAAYKCQIYPEKNWTDLAIVDRTIGEGREPRAPRRGQRGVLGEVGFDQA